MLDPVIEAMQRLAKAYEDLGSVIESACSGISSTLPDLEAEAAIEAERQTWRQADRDNYVRGQLAERTYLN